MKVKDLTKEEWSFLFECLKWNKHTYQEKWDEKYNDIPRTYMKENLKRMEELENKLHKIQNES